MKPKEPSPQPLSFDAPQPKSLLALDVSEEDLFVLEFWFGTEGSAALQASLDPRASMFENAEKELCEAGAVFGAFWDTDTGADRLNAELMVGGWTLGCVVGGAGETMEKSKSPFVLVALA